jgi:hypothetical protein
MTKKELIISLEGLRDDDPIVIEINNEDKWIPYWKDTYDFTIKTEKLDEDYTEIRFKLMPN